MLKFVLLCVILWHGMCEFSCLAHPSGSTDTVFQNFPKPVARRNNYTDVRRIDPLNVTYNINITIFNVNGVLTGSQPASIPASPTASVPASPTASIPASPTASIPASPTASIPVTQSPIPITPRPISPPPGYTVTDGIGAHKLHTNRVVWSTARQICIGEGGDLAVIKSYAEEEIVKKMMGRSSVLRAWVGFYRQSRYPGWITVFNQILAENPWQHWKIGEKKDEPQHACVSFVTVGDTGMTTISCDYNRAFICKIATV